MIAGGCAVPPDCEEQFFDVSSAFSSCPSSPVPKDCAFPEGNLVYSASGDDRYEVWCRNSDSLPECRRDKFAKWIDSGTGDALLENWYKTPDSVLERRDKFMKWIGWDLIASPGLREFDSDDECGNCEEISLDRVVSDVALGRCELENVPSMSSWSSEEPGASGDAYLEEEYRIKSLDDGRVFFAGEFGKDGRLRSLRELGRDQTISIDEFERSFGSSAFVEKIMRREDSTSSSNSDKSVRRRRMGWLKRLGAVACIVDRHREKLDSCNNSDSDSCDSPKIQRVKVHPYKKKSKDFSAVFIGQDIKAHDGAILTMKFSPDGQYLASGGEDGVVRVWHVMKCERTDEFDLPEDDPSCIHFIVNDKSKLAPLYAEKEKKMKSGILKKTGDLACVVIPFNIFRIQEKPLHEFYGHHGDVLDLSWSKDEHLLSSSVDKTVRLWRLGGDSCIEVFCHSDYVTCVQFNPVSENYFVSGSIDGKVRIWEISRCRVVNWIDIREIITAVCYRPDGNGCVVGTITGDCRFYDALDNHLKLDSQVSFRGKKKSPDKRITGFQFCPSDPTKLLLTSADSQVRILDGVDVVGRYRGFHNTGSQISASFTSDGKHIISASEDSKVYVWSNVIHEAPASNHVKSTWSSERFTSKNASVAIPWNGFKSKSENSASSELLPSQQEAFMEQTGYTCHAADTLDNNNDDLSQCSQFTLNWDFFSEYLSKASSTWPEETLPSSSVSASALCKLQYKFLKTSCQNSLSAWGQVIVTAGWDGRIKSFLNYGLPVNM